MTVKEYSIFEARKQQESQIQESLSQHLLIFENVMTINFKGMNNILSRFNVKKKLGQGAYGEVVLAENSKGEKVAIKIIVKSNLDSYEYLEGEIKCMQDIKSDHVVKIIERDEDESCIYLVCEYCDGGDLFNYQAKKENKRFKVDEAAKVLSQVIVGLESLHRHQYLHRDIKSQNILVSKIGDMEVFKLADLGFAKKAENVHGTTLGTEKFMAPEIYDQNGSYSYEVDMWAFGIVFFFMLNAEYPFNLNPYLMLEKKCSELTKLAKNFSYKAAVQKTRAKDMSTCNPDTEDLFKRMLEVDQKKRIRFSDIREHAVFKKYFKEGAGDSKILYSKNLNIASQIKKNKNRTGLKQDPSIPPSTRIFQKTSYTGNFKQEKTFIEARHAQFKYLIDSEQQILKYSVGALEIEEIQCLRYCLIKQFLILLSNFVWKLNEGSIVNDAPHLRLKEYLETEDLKKMVHQYEIEISTYELKLSNMYSDCQNCIPKIQAFNQLFSEVFEESITAEKSGKSFTKSYRIIIKRCYDKIEARKEEKRGFFYLTIVLLICYIFDKIVKTKNEDLHKVFRTYVSSQEIKNNQVLDFEDIRSWIRCTDIRILNELFNNFYAFYFSKTA